MALRNEEAWELPKPTKDMAQAKADLDQYGFCLIAEALTPEETAALRARLAAVAAAERADGTGSVFDKDQSQAVNALLNKGKPFVDLVQSPMAMELMGHLLGEKFILSNTAALIKGPGGPAQIVHADQAFMPEPWNMPLSANVMWMLDDWTEAAGATRVVPGSHLLNRNPPGGDYTFKPQEVNKHERPKTVAVEAPAGTAMIFEGRLWHCGGGNRTTDKFRHGLMTYYCRGFLRTQENWWRSLSPQVTRDMTPVLSQLLGYEQYSVLGGVSR
jgi:ectoine hydroxylase-related dioxygenase (phytanoyl-CoA dioxygenase family)